MIEDFGTISSDQKANILLLFLLE